jgi:hypothetical protein
LRRQLPTFHRQSGQAPFFSFVGGSLVVLLQCLQQLVGIDLLVVLDKALRQKVQHREPAEILAPQEIRVLSREVASQLHEFVGRLGIEKPQAGQWQRRLACDVADGGLQLPRQLAKLLASCVVLRQRACGKRQREHRNERCSRRPRDHSHKSIPHFPYLRGGCYRTANGDCSRSGQGPAPW